MKINKIFYLEHWNIKYLLYKKCRHKTSTFFKTDKS